MALVGVNTTVEGGVVDSRYDLQYYLDFCRNKGMFSTGATNIVVNYTDGTSIANNVIPLMPNLDSYGQVASNIINGLVVSNGGTNLVSAQFVYGAKHVYAKVGNVGVAFLTENGGADCVYNSANLNMFGTDSAMQRLTKLVTDVVYTPLATDAFMETLSANSDWIYRLGNGGTWSNGKSISTGSNALGGIVNLSSIWHDSATGEWYLEGWARNVDRADDMRTPLDMGVYFGDSGSPCIAWDAQSEQFLYVGALFAGNVGTSFPNWYIPRYNPTQAFAVMESYTVAASFSGTETIIWGAQDAVTGQGSLTQGDSTVTYTGKGTDNTIADTLGLTFMSSGESVQHLELQDSVNLGAGALTFESGEWLLTETEAAHTLSSAGFEIKTGAELTLELTGSAAEEIRKVGEGTLTIAGSGNNEAALVVGGGSTVYNISYDEEGNIAGCTLGNAGESRLARENGYAASSVRLEGGVAIVVLMGDNQFKPGTVAGDSFTFGNDGGLLNLNGHDLTWAVIQQDGSGKGARIGNVTPLGEEAPTTATFTYTGSTGTFAGCFVDEGEAGAQLAVVYDCEGGTWTLTGNSDNTGGYTVAAGTLQLQGTLTEHVLRMDSKDWTYASVETSSITVKTGAALQLSHHALLSADITVEQGATFTLKQTAHAAEESIQGSLRMDMNGKDGYGLITSYKGNVTLNGDMVVDSGSSSVASSMVGNISGTGLFTKKGGNDFVVYGQVSVVSGSVEDGGVAIKSAENFSGSWTIAETAYLGVEGLNGEAMLPHISTDSAGVLALGANQAAEMDLAEFSNLYIGALGTLGEAVEYGSADFTLSTNADGNWLLGGGGGTLNVNFLLTGEGNLIIGNESSSGTVHLANAENDFNGDIYILGTGNMLTYVDGALGNALVALSYGNTLALNNTGQLSILKEGARGVLALTQSQDVDLSGKTTSIGANGDVVFSHSLTVDGMYRFGGSGNLTLDTELNGADSMVLDGQGNYGSSVTFARPNAYTGSIVAGGGVYLEDAGSSGDIGIHVGHEEALASVDSIILQKGAILFTDGNSLVVSNLTAESGSSIRNNGSTASLLQLHVAEGVSTSIADGVLEDSYNSAPLALLKTGTGTLTMGKNSAWSAGLTIMEGVVNASQSGSSAIGAADSSIYVGTDGTLNISQSGGKGYALMPTAIDNQLRGTGVIGISSGNSTLVSLQGASFQGTYRLMGNTRLYLGNKLVTGDFSVSYNNTRAFDAATIEVTDGSQVRITPSLRYLQAARVSTNADFIISGTGFKGSDSGLLQSILNAGALSIDSDSIVYGNVTLAADATIASWSAGKVLDSLSSYSGHSTTPTATDQGANASYALRGYLGGTIRGQILGEGMTLTLAGNEGLTFTADSANTFANLIIANGNGNNTDEFALRLDGGAAENQVSTALGLGEVTLADGLILRLAGTGVAGSNVVYTYENTIKAGEAATLQSYYITNRLTSVVDMGANTTLCLATANGGILELAGGVNGTGTLKLAAGSEIILGSAVSTMALARSSLAQFNGVVEAESGADITLASPTVVSADTSFIGTDALILRLGGTDDFTLGSISVGESAEGVSSTLTLQYDFSSVPVAADSATWTCLSVSNGITADAVVIELALNMFNDVESGSYTLISTAESGITYSLADDLNERLSLSTANGALVLNVGADNRLYWSSASGTTQEWNSAVANWYQESSAAHVQFTDGCDVVLSASGVTEDNSADAPETLSLTEDVSIGTMAVKDAGAYYAVTGAYTLSGGTLAVGEGGNVELSVAAASFTDVYASNGSLTISGTALTAAVTVENGASFALSNNAALTGNLSVDAATANLVNSVLNGKISVFGEGSATLSNLRLTGEIVNDADGRIMAASAYDGSSATYAEAVLSGTLGEDSSLSLSSGALYLDGAVNLAELSVGDGLVATVWNSSAASGAEKLLGTVSLANGAVIQTNDRNKVTAATHIGTLQLAGESATLRDQFHSGYYSIGSLDLGDGISAATLNIVKIADSTLSTVVLLGHETTAEGNFSGSINLSSSTGSSDDSKRSLFLVLGGENAAGGAVINLNAADSADAVLGLGINTDSASIAGLVSSSGLGARAKVFSGSVGTETAWGSGDSAPATVGTAIRTLTIKVADGATHDFYGEIMGSLNLVKTGEGTQNLLGSSSQFNGSLSVQGGTMGLGSAAAVGTLSGLSVSNGATLDLSALTFTPEAGALVLSAGAIGSFDSGAHIVFGAMAAETEYAIFDLSSGASLSGWDSLGTDNFTINGVAMSDMGRVKLALNSSAGTFTYYEEYYDLVWSGGATGGVWNRAEDNLVWQQSLAGSLSGDLCYFANYDNVTFNASAAVEVTEAVTAGSVTVTGGASVVLTETSALTATSVTVDEGATLTFATERAGYRAENMHGSGTVVLDLTNSWNNPLKLGASFAGDTYVTSGYIDLTGASVGHTLRLADGVNANSATGVTTVSADLILEGVSTIHANGSKPITYTGSVTGENGIFKSNGGSSHTFEGVVNLAGFETLHSGNTNNFNAETTLGAATISQATVNFNGDTAITTATVSGGTVNFAATALNIGTLTRSGGTVNFNLNSSNTTAAYSVGAFDGIGGGSINVAQNVLLTAESMLHHQTVGGGGTLNIDGELNITGAMNLSYGWGESITGSGKINVRGDAQFTTWGSTNVSVAELNVAGNLGLGSYGTEHTFNLSAGSLTVAGTLSMTQNMGGTVLNITGGSLVLEGGADMGVGSVNLSAGSLVQSGGSSAVSNALTLSGGELVVRGGSMRISSAPTVSGGSVTVQGGTLALTADSAALLGTAGGITLSGGVLDLSSISYSDSGGIVLGSAMSVSGGILALGSGFTEGTTYCIFDLTADGAALDNWQSLAANISVNGYTLSRYSGASLALTDDAATLSFSSFEVTNYTDMVWNGGSAGMWDFSSANWDITPDVPDDNITFVNGDSVIFANDAVVEVTEGITVAGLTLNENVQLTTDAGLSITGSISAAAGSVWTLAAGAEQSLSESQLSGIGASLVVGAGASLAVTDMQALDGSRSAALDAVSGAGDVVLNYAVNGNGAGFDFSGLSGTVQVDSGRVCIDASEFADAAEAQPLFKLMSANSQLVFSGSGAVLYSNVELGAATTIHVNNGCSGTVSGVISGSYGLTKAGSGVLTFTTQNTYTGATSINGKIILANGADYLLYNSVSGGTLEVASATTLKNSGKQISSALVLNAGDASLNGDRMLRGNVTVHDGASLTTLNNDVLMYGSGAYSLTVAEGGVVDFGNTRQTMGSFWTINLTGGEIAGAGAAYGSVYVAAIDNYNTNATYAVNATSGDSKISATTGMRSSDSTLAYTVAEGASLTVSGAVLGAGAVSKSGAGDLIFTCDHSYSNSTSITAGKLILDVGGNYTLDGDVTGAGTLQVNSGTVLQTSGYHISTALHLNDGELVAASQASVVSGPVSGSGAITVGVLNSSAGVYEGAGSISFSGLVQSSATVKAGSGQVIFANTDSSGNSVATIDAGLAGTAVGQVVVSSGASLVVSTAIFLSSEDGGTAAVQVENGAVLTHAGLQISGNSAQADAKLYANTNRGQYNVGSGNFSVEHAHVSKVAEGTMSLGNKLSDVVVENAASGKLTLTNAANSLISVYATVGDVELQNMATYGLEELKIAAGLTVSAYSGTVAEAQYESVLRVDTLARFGVNTTLNADLVLGSGAELHADGAVTMGSDLTLEGNHELSGDLLSQIRSASYGQSVVLFSGIDTLYLGSQAVTEDITLDMQLMASDYFSNLTRVPGAEYYLTYSGAGTGNGILSVAIIPEPASATLSLLALLALASRRRRR